MTKLIFFDFKRNKAINILLIIQIILWIFYVSSLFSLLTFEDSYTTRYDRSFQIEKSFTIKFYKMMLNNPGESDKYVDILKVLEEEGLDYGLARHYYQSEDVIDPNILNINKKHFKKNFRDDEFVNEYIEPIVINYTLVNKLSKYIDGDIDESHWKVSGDNIPILMGKDFKKEYKIGDILNYNNINFEIKGFFNESILVSTYTSTTDSARLTDGSIIFPINDDYDLTKYSYEPILVYGNDEDINTLIKIVEEKISKITTNFTIDTVYEDLTDFLKQVENKKLFEIIRVIIISVIATASIIITILYKIMYNKERIGILYAIGYSKKQILRILNKEFLGLLLVSNILGVLLYLKYGKIVFVFFLNENLIFNLSMSLIIINILVFITGRLSMNYINKLTPHELIGGFRE